MKNKKQKYLSFLDTYSILFLCVAALLLGAYVLLEGAVEKDIAIAMLSASGALITGMVTLIGVRWTITEQRKQFELDKLEQRRLFFHDKYETARYLSSRLADNFEYVKNCLNQFIVDTSKENSNKLRYHIEKFMKTIEENQKLLMSTEIDFLVMIENTFSLLRSIEEYEEDFWLGLKQDSELVELKVLRFLFKEQEKLIYVYIEENKDKSIRG